MKTYWCELCNIESVICDTCGNNVCNGGNGELEDGSECKDCEAAYQYMLEINGL